MAEPILVESGYLMRPWRVDYRRSVGEDLMTGRRVEDDEYRLVMSNGEPVLGKYDVYGPKEKPILDLIVEAVNHLSVGPQGQVGVGPWCPTCGRDTFGSGSLNAGDKPEHLFCSTGCAIDGAQGWRPPEGALVFSPVRSSDPNKPQEGER